MGVRRNFVIGKTGAARWGERKAAHQSENLNLLATAAAWAKYASLNAVGMHEDQNGPVRPVLYVLRRVEVVCAGPGGGLVLLGAREGRDRPQHN